MPRISMSLYTDEKDVRRAEKIREKMEAMTKITVSMNEVNRTIYKRGLDVLEKEWSHA